MNENVHMAHENFHTNPCVFTAPDARHTVDSHKLKLPKTFIGLLIKYNAPPHPRLETATMHSN